MSDDPLAELEEFKRLFRSAMGRCPKTRAPPDMKAKRRSRNALPVVRLSIDLLLFTRQAGLSPEEAGCLFLLMASQLLDDVPPATISEMMERVR